MPLPYTIKRLLLPKQKLTVAISTTIPALANVDSMFLVTMVFSRWVRNFSLTYLAVTKGSAVYFETADNKTFTVYIVPNGTGNVTVQVPKNAFLANSNPIRNEASNLITVTANTSWVGLSTNTLTNFFYDFRELVGQNADTITTTDPGRNDLSGNNRTGVLINAPTIRARAAVGENGIVAFRDLLTAAISIGTGNTGSTIFNKNFAFYTRMQFADGQPLAAVNVCGNTDASGNKGPILTFTTAGNLLVSYQSNTLGFVWTSTSSVLANGQTAVTDFYIKFDFVGDVLTVLQDGSAVAGSFTTRSIALTDPTTYAATSDFVIGGLNTSGTINSNADSVSIYYFACTDGTENAAAYRTYLNAKKACIELVSTVTSASFLKFPHYASISADATTAYVIGKGDAALTNVDGSLGSLGITTAGILSVLGGYSGHGDLIDGETTAILSPTRTLAFANNNTLLFDTTTPAAPTLLRTVANGAGVINGYVKIGNYIIGANKGGFIDVFDISVFDTFTLVGSYNTGVIDGMIGPHDVVALAGNEHIAIVSRTTGAQFAIYKIFNLNALIPIASWTRLSFINSVSSPNLAQANRIARFGNTVILHMLQSGSGGDNIVTIDVSNPAVPVVLGDFSLTLTTSGSAGKGQYRGKYEVVATDVGVRIIDITTNPSSMTQVAGYYNANDFTVGANANFHECPVFTTGGQVYFLMTCQQVGGIVACFRINDRFR